MFARKTTSAASGVATSDEYATQAIPLNEVGSATKTHRPNPARLGSRTDFFAGTYFPYDTKIPSKGSESSMSKPHGSITPGWRYIYIGTLAILDAVMLLLSATIALLPNNEAYKALHGYDNGFNGVLIFAFSFVISGVLCLLVSHAYERHTMSEGYELYKKIMNAMILNFIAFCTVLYGFDLSVPRSVTFLAPAMAFVLLTLERWGMRRALHRNRRNGDYLYSTLIVGSPAGIRKTIKLLTDDPGLGYRPDIICPITSSHDNNDPNSVQTLTPVAFKPANEKEERLKVLALNSRLPQTARYLGITSVLIADVITRDSETMRTLSLAIESMGLEMAMTPDVANINGTRLHTRANSTVPVVTASLPQYSPITKSIKRCFDIVLSLFALIASSPIMAYVAIRVKMEDGGPALYTQQRIGLHGKPFTLYKFRSMKVNADKQDKALANEMGTSHGILFKAKEDPRITPFGKFIRKTSLDEFPQFFNVLRGDMSLVGPRPQQQYEVDEYGSLYSTRLLVKPGITGLWQISGRSDLSQADAERLDVSYVENWSITGDIAILIKTISAVLKGTGSY